MILLNHVSLQIQATSISGIHSSIHPFTDAFVLSTTGAYSNPTSFSILMILLPFGDKYN